LRDSAAQSGRRSKEFWVVSGFVEKLDHILAKLRDQPGGDFLDYSHVGEIGQW
jgi:hypothetical protein